MKDVKNYMVYDDEGSFLQVNDIDVFINHVKKEDMLEDMYLLCKSSNDIGEAMIELEKNGLIETINGDVNIHIYNVACVNNTLDLISELLGKTKTKELDAIIFKAREEKAAMKTKLN